MPRTCVIGKPRRDTGITPSETLHMASSGGRNTPYSTTAARTAPALVSRAARGDPLVAWPAGVGHSRAAATASETAEQSLLSGKRGPQDGQDFGDGPGAGLLDALAPQSTTTAPHGTTPALALHAVRASPRCAPPVARTPSQPRVAVTESDNSACDFSRAPFSRWNTRLQYGPCFSCRFSCRH